MIILLLNCGGITDKELHESAQQNIKEKNYPEILVLEMGVDKPGDMDYLNSIVECQVGVLTMVGTVHAEYFSSREELRQEKAKLFVVKIHKQLIMME